MWQGIPHTMRPPTYEDELRSERRVLIAFTIIILAMFVALVWAIGGCGGYREHGRLKTESTFAL